MPALAALCREGAVTRVRTIPPGLPAGSEVGVPALLGWLPGSAVDRGALEAAAAGCARLMGARVVTPNGATGDVDTDLGAKAEAALAAIAGGAARVAVHVGAPDEAAHAGDAAAKVAALERIDRELIAPLVAAVARAGGRVAVCPDHGCDPAGGRHDAAPVPAVVAGAGVAAAGPDAFSERAVAELPAEAPSWAAALGTAA
jgi:2,3-bisphosphoglycerate-independent phosphoglycerate mutase